MAEVDRLMIDEFGIQLIQMMENAGRALAQQASRMLGGRPAGRDVGTAAAYARDLDGRLLTFEFDGGAIRDQQTGSRWDALGHAVEGELAGAALQPVVAVNHFWFSWAAFKPETQVYQP